MSNPLLQCRSPNHGHLAPLSMYARAYSLYRFIPYILCIGGFTKSVSRYDPSRDKWTAAPSLTYDHSAGAAVALHGRAFVCGGEKSVICEVYDARVDKKWQSLPSSPHGSGALPHARQHSSLVCINDYTALMIGGISFTANNHSTRAIFEYDVCASYHSYYQLIHFPCVSCAN